MSCIILRASLRTHIIVNQSLYLEVVLQKVNQLEINTLPLPPTILSSYALTEIITHRTKRR